MGLSKSKSSTTQTVAPSTYSQPYITDAANVLKPGFDAATANNASLMPRVNNALDYSQGVMNGDFLNGNPHLQSIIDSSNRDVTNGVSSRFEGAGRYGSGQYGGVLSRALLDNESKLRYADYAQERAYQNSAPGQLAGLVALSAGLPQAAGNTYSEAIRNIMGQYTTTNGTTTSSPAIGPSILGALASAAQAAAMGGAFGAGGIFGGSGGAASSGTGPAISDRRLKTNIKRLGEWDGKGDGLGRYEWNWRSSPNGEKVIGVIADEVEKLRPHAFVPNFIGQYAGVNYGAL